MISITKLFLKVLRAFVTGTKIDPALKPEFTPDTLEKLLNTAKAHDVAQIVSDVLFKNGLLDNDKEIAAEFQKYQLIALHRYMNVEREHQRIYKLFEDHAIEFVPLKGSVVRQYYPEPYMRTSKDIDILIHEEDLHRAYQTLVSALDYQGLDVPRFHDISLFSQSGVQLELHFNLQEKRENLDKLLRKVWDHCVDTGDGKYHKQQSPEYYIFHHLAHMVNHFLRGGCGIRPFIDLYYIQKHIAYDVQKLQAFMAGTEIADFYRAAMQCVAVWFGDGESTEIVELMESFILKGGLFGTRENRLNIDQTRSGGKIKFFFSRIFLPYEKLKYKYPVLQKCKILLPVMWLVRIVSFISPQKRRRAHEEMEIQRNISENAERKTDKMLKLLKIQM